MNENFNVGNPTKENIDFAFKNLIFYITASIQLDIYKEQKKNFEKVLVEINTILATYVNKESLISINEEKLQNIINHIFGMTCDRIQESEIDFAMNHKKCIYCAADDFEDLMAEPEKIICVEMPNVTHHAWKTLNDAKKVQQIEKALMENKVI